MQLPGSFQMAEVGNKFIENSHHPLIRNPSDLGLRPVIHKLTMEEASEKFNESAPPSVGGGDRSGTGGEDMVPQQSRVESIWPAENISFPREVLMVFVACMAQFCTRKLPSLFALSFHPIDLRDRELAEPFND
jgi:hypothetical protein